MSQEASTRRIVSEPVESSSSPASQPEEFISSEPWSMDSYADGLMDEIFSDLDEILEAKGKLPSSSGKPEYVTLKTIKVPHIVMPEAVLPSDLVHQPQPAPAQSQSTQLSTFVADTTVVKPPRPQKAKQKKKSAPKFSKLLLILGAIASVSAIALLLWAFMGKLNRQNTPSTTPSATEQQVSTQAQTEAELGNYIAQSLDSIEQKVAKRELAAKIAKNNPANNPPPVATTNNPAPAANNRPAPTTVLERIYIPVYQPALPMRYAPPSIMGATAPLPCPANLKAAKTPLRQAPKPKSAPAAKKPAPAAKTPSGRQVPKLPTLQTAAKPLTVRPNPRLPSAPAKPPARVAPQNTAKPAPRQQAPAPRQQVPAPAPAKPPAPAPIQRYVPAPPPPAPVTNHRLDGVLDLGDPSRNAALFNIDGVTRQVRVGENIGSSGWSLVEVVNNEAIIRRNGEVRSIYPGQKF